MPKAYSLSGRELSAALSKFPWLTFPDGLTEVLCICDERGDPRHLRGYVEAGGKRSLLQRNSIDTDVVLALVKITRRNGSAYDLTAVHEAKVERIIGEDGDLQKAYAIIRDHLMTVIASRLKIRDPHAERLHRLCDDIPHELLAVKEDHEACFAEFDAWHQVAALRDLAHVREVARGA